MFYKRRVQTKKIEEMGSKKQKMQWIGSEGKSQDISYEVSSQSILEQGI